MRIGSGTDLVSRNSAYHGRATFFLGTSSSGRKSTSRYSANLSKESLAKYNRWLVQPDLQSDAPKFFRITVAPCASSNTVVLATLLTKRGGIENNFSGSSIRQREQIVDVLVDLLGLCAVPSKSRF